MSLLCFIARLMVSPFIVMRNRRRRRRILISYVWIYWHLISWVRWHRIIHSMRRVRHIHRKVYVNICTSKIRIWRRRRRRTIDIAIANRACFWCIDWRLMRNLMRMPDRIVRIGIIPRLWVVIHHIVFISFVVWYFRFFVIMISLLISMIIIRVIVWVVIWRISMMGHCIWIVIIISSLHLSLINSNSLFLSSCMRICIWQRLMLLSLPNKLALLFCSSVSLLTMC